MSLGISGPASDDLVTRADLTAAVGLTWRIVGAVAAVGAVSGFQAEAVAR